MLYRISSNITTTEQCRQIQSLRNSKKEKTFRAKLHIQSHENTCRSKSYYKPNSMTNVALLILHTYSLENLHIRLTEYSCDSRKCAGEVAE